MDTDNSVDTDQSEGGWGCVKVVKEKKRDNICNSVNNKIKLKIKIK